MTCPEMTADDYVTGCATHAVEIHERMRIAAGNPNLIEDTRKYGEALFASGDFPELEALSTSPPADFENPDAGFERRFSTGLAALLDGLESHYPITPII